MGGTRQIGLLLLDCCYPIAKEIWSEEWAELSLKKCCMNYFVYKVMKKKGEIMIIIHSPCVAE